MTTLKRITAPAVSPVSLAEAKAQLDIGYTDKDALIQTLIDAATAYLDGWSGVLCQALVTQTWELYLDQFPSCGEIELPIGPIQSVTSVKYDAANGDEQTVSIADYDVDIVSTPGWVLPVQGVSWPSTADAVNAVRVRFVCGFGDAGADVPAAVRQVIFMLVRHWFDNPSAVITGTIATQTPLAVDTLIAMMRRVRV